MITVRGSAGALTVALIERSRETFAFALSETFAVEVSFIFAP